MKKSYFFALGVLLAALLLVSCKNNNKKSEDKALTAEQVQQTKDQMAESVLETVDAIEQEYRKASQNSFCINQFELTEKEKMVKPDYLLEPQVANTLVTRSQKINALGIYFVEYWFRKLYDMPVEEVQQVIVKLAADVNYPLDVEYAGSDASVSDKLAKEYEACKKAGALAAYWQYRNAVLVETDYLIAQNSRLFFNRITPEQWLSYYMKMTTSVNAIKQLSEYDEEMAAVNQMRIENRVAASDEELFKANRSTEAAKLFHLENKEKFAAARNALIQ